MCEVFFVYGGAGGSLDYLPWKIHFYIIYSYVAYFQYAYTYEVSH